MRLALIFTLVFNLSFGQLPISGKYEKILYYCDFDSSICDIRQQANNRYKWLLTHKRTSTDRTGPETAHSNGRYVYAEANNAKPGDTIIMQTGWMEPRSTNISITFYRHMYGEQVGQLSLYVQTCYGVASTSRPVWSMSGNSGNQWLRTDVNVELGEFPYRFKIKFEAVRGIGDLGDIAIDTLTVRDSPALEESCYNGLGIENGIIPDTALTASSSYGPHYGPRYSRLNSIAELPERGGWSAGFLDRYQWIQVNLGESHLVTGVAVQAREDSSQWVSSYRVSYKLGYYSSWQYTPVVCGYTSNPEKRAVRAHFKSPIVAILVRIHPITWHTYISLRWEVYGCKESLHVLENRTISPTITADNTNIADNTNMGTSQSTGNTMYPENQTPIQMGNITQYPNSLVTAGDFDNRKSNKTTEGVSSINLPGNVQEKGKGYSLVMVEIVCISIGLALLIVSILIIVCLTRKLKRRKEEACNTPAQSRRRLLYNAYECIDDIKSRSIINNAYSTYSINSCVEKDAVYQDISEIKRRDENTQKLRNSAVCVPTEPIGKVVTVSRSKTWSHNDEFKERTLPRKSFSMGNERRPEMFIRRPSSKKAPPRIEFRCKVPRTPPPPVPCLSNSEHANTFHVREYCSAPDLPRPRPHSDFNLQNDTGSKVNLRHTVFLPPANANVQKARDLSAVRMSNLTDNLGYSDAIYAEPRDTLLEHEAKTSLAKSKDSAFDFDSDPEDETIWEDNPIYEDSDSLSDTDYTTSTLDYSDNNVAFRISCFGKYDEVGNDFLRKSHIYSEITEIN